MLSLPSFWHHYRSLVIQELDKLIPKDELFDIIRYHLGLEKGGGKMARAVVCLASCRAVGGDISRALPAACAVELLHNFTLIHDDIEDGSPTRRGRPTVWKVYGEAQAINAGDALFALAHLSFLRLEEKAFPPRLIMKAQHLLNQTCLKMCHGQYLDLAREKEAPSSREQYLAMAGKKTGALFECSLALGAMLGGASEEVIQGLGRCGYLAGTAFQIQDDALSFLQEDVEEIGIELTHRKKSFPIFCALERVEVRNGVREIYQKPKLETEDSLRLIHLLKESGCVDEALAVADDLYRRAEAELSSLNLPYDMELREIIIFLRRRRT